MIPRQFKLFQPSQEPSLNEQPAGGAPASQYENAGIALMPAQLFPEEILPFMPAQVSIDGTRYVYVQRVNQLAANPHEQISASAPRILSGLSFGQTSPVGSGLQSGTKHPILQDSAPMEGNPLLQSQKEISEKKARETAALLELLRRNAKSPVDPRALELAKNIQSLNLRSQQSKMVSEPASASAIAKTASSEEQSRPACPQVELEDGCYFLHSKYPEVYERMLQRETPSIQSQDHAVGQQESHQAQCPQAPISRADKQTADRDITESAPPQVELEDGCYFLHSKYPEVYERMLQRETPSIQSQDHAVGQQESHQAQCPQAPISQAGKQTADRGITESVPPQVELEDGCCFLHSKDPEVYERMLQRENPSIQSQDHAVGQQESHQAQCHELPAADKGEPSVSAIPFAEEQKVGIQASQEIIPKQTELNVSGSANRDSAGSSASFKTGADASNSDILPSLNQVAQTVVACGTVERPVIVPQKSYVGSAICIGISAAAIIQEGVRAIVTPGKGLRGLFWAPKEHDVLSDGIKQMLEKRAQQQQPKQAGTTIDANDLHDGIVQGNSPAITLHDQVEIVPTGHTPMTSQPTPTIQVESSEKGSTPVSPDPKISEHTEDSITQTPPTVVASGKPAFDWSKVEQASKPTVAATIPITVANTPISQKAAMQAKSSAPSTPQGLGTEQIQPCIARAERSWQGLHSSPQHVLANTAQYLAAQAREAAKKAQEPQFVYAFEDGKSSHTLSQQEKNRAIDLYLQQHPAQFSASQASPENAVPAPPVHAAKNVVQVQKAEQSQASGGDGSSNDGESQAGSSIPGGPALKPPQDDEDSEVCRETNSNLQNQTKEQLLRGKRSHEKLIQEHEAKLEAYKNNPDANDNLGLLKNVSEEIRAKRIEGRIESLKTQIASQTDRLNEIIKALSKFKE